jgi:nicotinate-nucleotide adenylyltransferase
VKVLFGGTFDPVHCGHIKLATHISSFLNHKVSLLPLAGVPNYKPAPTTLLSDRLAMLDLVVACYPNYMDVDLSETIFTEYSPTVVTLTRMRNQIPAQEPIFFIIGGDSLVALNSWDNWQTLFSLTNFIVAMRPDYPLNLIPNNLAKVVRPRLSNKVDLTQASGQIVITNFEPMAISSTAIRRLITTNQPLPPKWLLPEVLTYIRQHNLYKEI